MDLAVRRDGAARFQALLCWVQWKLLTQVDLIGCWISAGSQFWISRFRCWLGLMTWRARSKIPGSDRIPQSLLNLAATLTSVPR